MPSNLWTKEEEEFVLQNYEEIGANGCSKHINRTPRAITNYVYRHGLNVKYNPAGKDSRNLKAKNEYPEYAASLGFTVKGEYTNNYTHLIHEHSCGYTWSVTPNNFKKIKGCPACRGSVDDKVTYVYVCFFPELNLHKVGITSSWTMRRRDFKEEVELVHLWPLVDRASAFNLEKFLLEIFKEHTINTGLLNSGNTETFQYTP